MDPITLIVTALVTGAAVAAKDVGIQAVKDGYAGLKALILRKFGSKADVESAVTQVEKKPDSEGRKATLKEELQAAGADKDEELLKQAQVFLELLRQHNLGTGAPTIVTVTGSGAAAVGPGAVAAGERGIAIGGSVQGGNIITGDNNVVGANKDKDK